jgi:hypothetical protein
MQATVIYGTQKGNVILVVGDVVKHFDNLTDAIVEARRMTGTNPKVVSR